MILENIKPDRGQVGAGRHTAARPDAQEFSSAII
jgi:hypothetical protein